MPERLYPSRDPITMREVPRPPEAAWNPPSRVVPAEAIHDDHGRREPKRVVEEEAPALGTGILQEPLVPSGTIIAVPKVHRSRHAQQHSPTTGGRPACRRTCRGDPPAERHDEMAGRQPSRSRLQDQRSRLVGFVA